MSELKINPLEWGKTSYGTPEAHSVAGVYRINHAGNGGWSVVFKTEVLRAGDGRTNFATLDDAKAAAQRDYETRIMSAITVEHAEPVAYGEEYGGKLASVSLTRGGIAQCRCMPIHWLTPHTYAQEYEFRGDGGDYVPTDGERTMIEDAILGYLGEVEEARAALAEENRRG